MLLKVLDMFKRMMIDIFFWFMLLSNLLVKWSSVDLVEWNFLFLFCIWCMILYELRKLISCEWVVFLYILDRIGSSEIGFVFVDF